MATKKFLTSVADVLGYDSNDNLLFTAKTMLDSSIEVSLGSAPVRGGRGNQLQYTYYHTAELKFNLTETQWNLEMLGQTAGADFELGNYYVEETVNVTSSSGSVTQTPLAFESIVYGWATSPLGVTQRVTFTGKGFTVTGSETSGAWCVRYYTANTTSGKTLTIKANMIPNVVKLVMETQLNSADATTNKIGIVQIIIPKAQLSGAFSIAMKADGVSNTPLTGTALSYTPTSTSTDACSASTYYAKIIEVIDNTYWYNNISALSIYGGAFSLATGATKTLTVYGVPYSGASYKLPNSFVKWTSSSAMVTAGSSTGLITAGSTTGACTISACVVSASSVTAATAVCTVS